MASPFHKWKKPERENLEDYLDLVEVCARCECERRPKKPGEALDEPGGGRATFLYRRVGKRWTPNRPPCIGGGDPRSSKLPPLPRVAARWR